MRLQEKYNQQIRISLKEELGLKNIMAVPKVEKVVLNVGLGKGLKDAAYLETVESTLNRITGQKPISTKAKKAISNFKIREGNVIGMKVTLRGKRMYDFLEKLVNASLPRVRDFRGLDTKMVDKNGNLNIGFTEHIAFPEIKANEVERLHGLEVTVVTTAQDKEQGLALLKALGFPFKK